MMTIFKSAMILNTHLLDSFDYNEKAPRQANDSKFLIDQSFLVLN